MDLFDKLSLFTVLMINIEIKFAVIRLISCSANFITSNHHVLNYHPHY